MENEDKSKYDVFVSYSSKDFERVSQVVDGLRESGLKVWFDKTEIKPGDWIIKRVFEDGIKASAVVATFFSRNSLTSDFVANEIDSARWEELAKRVVVVPILLGKVTVGELPLHLRGKAFTDLRYNFDKKWQSQKPSLISTLIALARGEAQSGSETILRVGDPLIRFFNNYWRKKNIKDADYFDEDDVNKIALAMAHGALGSSVFKAEPVDPVNMDSESDLGYLERSEEFIRRYGEYSLQQMALYFLDQGRVDLASGFRPQPRKIGELMEKLVLIISLFEIYFAFEKLEADRSHHILVKILGTSFEVRLIGEVTKSNSGIKLTESNSGMRPSNDWVSDGDLGPWLYAHHLAAHYKSRSENLKE